MASSQCIRPFLSCCVLLGLSGCVAVGPNHEVPTMALPAAFSQGGVQWKRHSPEPLPSPQQWWRLYHDATLSSLIERSLKMNQDLKGSVARLRQAREMSKVARSLYFPDVNLGAIAERSQFRYRGPGEGVSVLSSNFSVPVDFRYEFDVWGKVSRQVESASASEAAAGETLNALRLSVAGEVAQTYWALRAVDANRAVLTRTLEIRRKALDLLTKRRDVGDISGLDLARAETEVATAEAERIRLDQDRIVLVNALAVLSGTLATGSAVAEQTDLPPPPAVPLSVPSEVLRQRPDIRAAERRVAAANANVGVATAAFYPSFSLNASSGLEAASPGGLFDASALVWSLGSSVLVPITSQKLLQAKRAAAVAAHEAASADYRQTVLESIREVENALQGSAILERRQVAQNRALAAARKTFELSVKRFQAGLVSFLDVVDAERTRLDAERATNAIRAERLAVSVSLIKALGGEW
ncbi:MAG: efflux transporter outer membrane subunit [Verrucomicrobia bacterium]|nr:efflux transporter outer membrane subunit [Verrucomicrobiota bacterium]